MPGSPQFYPLMYLGGNHHNHNGKLRASDLNRPPLMLVSGGGLDILAVPLGKLNCLGALRGFFGWMNRRLVLIR